MLKIEDYFNIKDTKCDSSKIVITMTMEDYMKQLEFHKNSALEKYKETVTRSLNGRILEQEKFIGVYGEITRILLTNDVTFKKHEEQLSKIAKRWEFDINDLRQAFLEDEIT